MTNLRLIADIGGTNVRIVVAKDGEFNSEDIPEHKATTTADIIQLFRDCLKETDVSTPIEAVIAVAAPVTGDIVTMTNRNWTFSTAELERNLGFSKLTVVNDFVGVAMAIPCLLPEERLDFGRGIADPEGSTAVIGLAQGSGLQV